MKFKSLLFIFLVTVGCQQSKLPHHFVIMNADSVYVDWKPDDYAYASDLTDAELQEIEKRILAALKAYPKDDFMILSAETLQNYGRQYIPYVNQNKEKLVTVYGFCRLLEVPVEISPDDFEFRPQDWKNEIMDTSDGGDCYWTFYINLTNNEYQLMVNGV